MTIRLIKILFPFFIANFAFAANIYYIDENDQLRASSQKEIEDLNSKNKRPLKPLWQLGFGGFWASFPDYPGSDFNYKLALPFPTAVYRGEVLRAKRDEGVRGRFINHPKFEIDLSFDGTLPSSDSKKNNRREGMEELDAVLEFGPKLIYHLYSSSQKLDFHLALRYGFSSDFQKWQDRGMQINPFFTYQIEEVFGSESFFLLSVGGKWSTRKLLDYYYGVDREFATNLRPYYHASSGLLEYSTSAIAHIPLYRNIMLFTGVIQAFYNKAANRTSPLLPKDQTTSVVIGLYIMPWKSDIFVFD